MPVLIATMSEYWEHCCGVIGDVARAVEADFFPYADAVISKILDSILIPHPDLVFHCFNVVTC